MYSLHHAQPSHGLIVSKARIDSAGFCFAGPIPEIFIKGNAQKSLVGRFLGIFLHVRETTSQHGSRSCHQGHSPLPTRQGEIFILDSVGQASSMFTKSLPSVRSAMRSKIAVARAKRVPASSKLIFAGRLSICGICFELANMTSHLRVAEVTILQVVYAEHLY